MASTMLASCDRARCNTDINCYEPVPVCDEGVCVARAGLVDVDSLGNEEREDAGSEDAHEGDEGDEEEPVPTGRPDAGIVLPDGRRSPPTAIARVKSINGMLTETAPPSVEPLDNLILSGDPSVGHNGAAITGYSWQIVEKPPESSIVLSTPQAMETGFQFSSAAGIVNGVDVAGTFVIRLEVTDSNGATSQNDARVTINAVPNAGLHVQLSWASPVSDIDLHLARGNAPDWASNNDCYYGNCHPGAGTGPGLDWDGDGVGASAGDPTPDIDDLEGFGPENITIEVPLNGTYTIGVEAFRLDEPTDFTIKIFIAAALVYEFIGHFNQNKEFWTVARIDINGTATITPIGMVSPSMP